MLLLKYSSDINQSDNEGKTALMHVCKLFNPEMKTLFDAILIHKQLDILKVDVDGWTALHWSSVNGHEQLVKKIISKFSSNSSLINMLLISEACSKVVFVRTYCTLGASSA